MNTKKQTNTSPLGSAENERCFVIPADFNLDQLVAALTHWMKKTLEQKTEVSKTRDLLVIHSRDTSGHLKRLVQRKAQLLHILMKKDENHLQTRIGSGRWTETEKTSASEKSGFNLFKIATSAIESAAGMAESAADGISDMLTETGTIDRIFHFIADHIAADFRARTGRPLTGIDASESRYVEAMTDVESTWLAGYRDPGEILLAWLKTSTADKTSGNQEWRYVLTHQRAALAAFSSTSFMASTPLPPAPMSVTDVLGRDTVTIADVKWRTQHGNDMLFQEIAPLSSLPPLKRLAEAARLNFIHWHKKAECRRHAGVLLRHALSLSDDPLAELSLFYIDRMMEKEGGQSPFAGDTHDGALPGIFRNLIETGTGNELADWASGWQISPWDQILLARSIANNSPADGKWIQLFSPMVSASRSTLLKKEKDAVRLVAMDVIHAKILNGTGRGDEAAALLEKRMAELPDETLSDLLPLQDTDLTKGEGGQLLKVEILECLAAIEKNPSHQAEIIRKLAVLQPMVSERLHRLRKICVDTLKQQATHLLGMLNPGGLLTAQKPEDPRLTGCKALSHRQIEDRLRHPAGREGSFLRRIGGFIASKKMPDHSALKAYAKKITPAAFPELTAALTDGAMMLEMPAPEGYISFGDLNTGVRGYEGDPAFLLIGSEHIEDGAAERLDPAEMRFLIGAELAHIKFKHERITSREVWEGAFDKAMSIVELVPVLGGYIGKIGALGKFAGHAADVAKKIGDVQSYISQARDVTASAQSILGGKKKGEAQAGSGPLSQDEQNLLFAFRIMQLTADRAGLLLCRDIRAAVRAVFRTTPALAAELAVADANGLDAFLSREDEKGDLIFQHLAIRLAALFSFYLGEDYEKLYQAIFSQTSEK